MYIQKNYEDLKEKIINEMVYFLIELESINETQLPCTYLIIETRIKNCIIRLSELEKLNKLKEE